MSQRYNKLTDCTNAIFVERHKTFISRKPGGRNRVFIGDSQRKRRSNSCETRKKAIFRKTVSTNVIFSLFFRFQDRMRTRVNTVFVLVGILLGVPLSFGQQANFLSRSELGVRLGGMYYIGDLNPFGHFKESNLAGGMIYRYNIHSRASLRATFTAGAVEAYDSKSNNPLHVNRNLSFASDIYEGAVGIEFNYFPFQVGHPRYRGTAYLFTEIGFFRMNPTTQYNNEVIELSSLGTEGQGTTLSSEDYYGLTQLTIPLGIGCRLTLTKNISLNLEYGIRKTFTDYLDDVGSSRYVNPTLLSEVNGPLAAALSNRSLDGSRFGKRGDATTNDWYSFFGMMLCVRLGQPTKCSF